MSPLALLRDKKELLERANLDLAEQVAALQAREGQGSLFDLHRSNADEIATSIVGELATRKGGRTKAREIANAILKKLAPGQVIPGNPLAPPHLARQALDRIERENNLSTVDKSINHVSTLGSR